jgi:hypothetical protein
VKNIITTRNFDTKSAAYLELKAEAERVDATIKGFKEAFLRFLKKYGARPEDAPKSRKFESDLYESLFSIGQKTEIDEMAVTRFMEALTDANLIHLFSQIFDVESKYALLPTAAETVKTLPNKLKQAYSRCLCTKPKPPAVFN